MKLSFAETKVLIDFVLSYEIDRAAVQLHHRLTELDYRESQFYDGVIEHGPFLNYTSEQWFDFHRKIPHWRLRDEPTLMNKLSPELLRRLTTS